MTKHMLMKAVCRHLTRKPDTHKGDYGHVFILAGSTGMTGAAALASWGALRAGAGLVTLGIPRRLNPILEVKLTEAMTLPLPDTAAGTLAVRALKPALACAARCDVVVLGPGLSRHPETQRFVRQFLGAVSVPVVLDADGLNALAGHREVLAKMKSSVIITPHPGEFVRIGGRNTPEDVRTMATRYGITVVLKGHRTLVAGSGKTYRNMTGNPGMATGGSGDVLAGMIAALWGQKLSPFEAAQYGVFIHGLAGDLARRNVTEISLTPSDLLEYIPRAFQACGLY